MSNIPNEQAQQIEDVFNDDENFLQWLCENFTIHDLLQGSKFLDIARSTYAISRATDLASEFEVDESEVFKLLQLGDSEDAPE